MSFSFNQTQSVSLITFCGFFWFFWGGWGCSGQFDTFRELKHKTCDKKCTVFKWFHSSLEVKHFNLNAPDIKHNVFITKNVSVCARVRVLQVKVRLRYKLTFTLGAQSCTEVGEVNEFPTADTLCALPDNSESPKTGLEGGCQGQRLLLMNDNTRNCDHWPV